MARATGMMTYHLWQLMQNVKCLINYNQFVSGTSALVLAQSTKGKAKIELILGSPHL